MAELKDGDIVILRMLQANAREKLENIAFESGLSVATVQRRIKHLKAADVIQGETAIVSPVATGYNMTFLIMVELERERIDKLDAFRRKAKAEPQVQQCYYITGEADFALVVLGRDMADFERLTQRLFFDDNNVKRFRTSVVLSPVKVGLEVPLAEEVAQNLS